MARSKTIASKKSAMYATKAVKTSKGLANVRAAVAAAKTSPAPPAAPKVERTVDIEKRAESRVVKYQNSTKLLMQRAPLERYVRAQAGNLIPDVHFRSEAMDLIHERLVFFFSVPLRRKADAPTNSIEFIIASVSADAVAILEHTGASLMGGETFDLAANIRGL